MSSVNEPQPPTSSRNWTFLALGGLLTALLPLTLDVPLPGFPELAEHFGTDISHLQLTISTALLGFAVGQIIWGPITDRFGRKRPMMVGLLIFIVASIGCALAPTLDWLIGLRLLQTLGGCVAVVGGRAMARDRYQGQALARAMAVIFLIFGLAPVASPFIGSVLVAAWSWQATYVCLAAFGVLAFAGVAAYPETLPAERRRAHGFAETVRAFGTVLRHPIALRAAALTFLAGAALFAWVAVAPAALMGEAGLSLTTFTIVFAIVSFVPVLIAQWNTMLLRRLDVHLLLFRLVAAMTIGGAVTLVATLAGAPLWLRIALIAVSLSPIIAVFGNTMTVGLEPFAAIAGAVAGIIGATQTVGGAASAALLADLPIAPALAMATGICIPMLIALPIAWSLRHVGRGDVAAA